MIALNQFSPKTGLSSFVASLFANGEQGAWYEPSLDNGTLFQDQAGTTPVTAVEQPVSLMLDKSKGGVGTNGVRRYNLLNYTEQFDNDYWTKTNTAISANTTDTTDPIGTNAADKITANSGSGIHAFQQPVFTITNGTTHTLSIYAKAGTQFYARFGRAGGQAWSVPGVWWWDLRDGTFNGTLGSGWSNASSTNIGDGWYRYTVSVTASGSGLEGFSWNLTDSSGNITFSNDGATAFAWGADLRLASQASATPTYQRITDQWYNTMAGNHAYTPSTATASRPVLSARVNLLTKTEQFDDAAWVKSGVTVTANATTAPDGTTTADLMYPNSSGTNRSLYQTINAGNKLSVYAKANGINHLAFVDTAGSGFFVWFNLLTGTVGTVLFGGTATITDAGNGWYLCTVIPPSGTFTYAQIGLTDANNSASVTASGTSGIYLWGADLRVANDGVGIPSYQRVNTSTDYDSVGFPLYLRCDGTDDYMLTNSIDFTATDKMTVWAGVRKLSDAAIGIVADISATPDTSNGSSAFAIINSTTYRVAVRGTNNNQRNFTSTAAPLTNVFAYIQSTNAADSAAAVPLMQINSVATSGAAFTNVVSTGNFGNYPLYLFRRGGTTLPFNGRCYGIIVRGAQSSTAQIQGGETYMNTRTRAF